MQNTDIVMDKEPLIQQEVCHPHLYLRCHIIEKDLSAATAPSSTTAAAAATPAAGATSRPASAAAATPTSTSHACGKYRHSHG